MFCTRCGTEIPVDAQYCTRCGIPSQTLAGTQPNVSTTTDLTPGASVPAETSGKAVGSLICGLLFFILPSAVAAIILGHVSLSEIRKSAGRIKGRGMAVTGLVLGYLGVAFIPFVLILAAIAIPNLLRARQAANEASAVGSLRTISRAAILYSSTYGNGFPPSLEAMDGAGDDKANCDHAQIINSPLASGRKSGYFFSYTAQLAELKQAKLSSRASTNDCSAAPGMAFTVTADPITRGTTGQRSFFTDESGVIRYDLNGTASKDSPPLE